MIINLLSGPRNVSTALMYSFAQRPDSSVIDEPLYGYYLKRSGADHPGKDEIIGTMDSDPVNILMNILKKDSNSSVIFIKNMCHHFIDLPTTMLLPFTNIFLIRDPREMLPSLAKQLKKPTLRDTALKHQWTLFTQLEEFGKHPFVIDSKILLQNPRHLLSVLCKRINIQFHPVMLKWDKGPRQEDGIWAKHWYDKIHESTGFSQYEEKNEHFPEHLNSLLKECRPYYQNLRHFALE
jgi:hypothetical protein